MNKHNLKTIPSMKFDPIALYALMLLCCVIMGCQSADHPAFKAVDSASVPLDSLKAQVDSEKKLGSPAADTPDSAKQEGDWLLQPGIAAGKTAINQTADQVYARLGKADGGDAAMGKAIAIWYNNHDSTAHSIAIYTVRDTGSMPPARVKQIRVTSPTFKTKEGIHAGSTLMEIKKVFQVTRSEAYKSEGENYSVYSSKQGVAFEINAAGECVSVLIFEAGKPSSTTYQKFRTTDRFNSAK
jgi:hypothetical protein